MQPTEKKTGRTMLSPARRWSGLYTIGLVLLVLIFFAIHQKRNTGFFTEKFGTDEMVALYVPIAISLAAPILRTVQGKIDPARLVEAISDVCLALGSIWLWITFPFDFSHFADIFPPALHPAFNWINNTVGRIILVLQIALGLISVLTSIASYARERIKGIKT